MIRGKKYVLPDHLHLVLRQTCQLASNKVSYMYDQEGQSEVYGVRWIARYSTQEIAVLIFEVYIYSLTKRGAGKRLIV